MKVLVTGATGFVGKVIVRQLLEAGHQVVVLTSNMSRACGILGNQCRYFPWTEVNTLPPLDAFRDVEGVIHLMGENISSKRWSEEQKQKIHDSRTLSTASIVKAMSQLEQRPRVLVSASAVGIYGDRGGEEIHEGSMPAGDFLATVCRDWEAEAARAQELGIRVVAIRTGVVLGQGGGALAKMLLPFKLGVGGVLGNGRQYMSWIHIRDLAELYLNALTNEALQGPVNGTSPNPVTNQEFTRILGRVVRRPTVFPVPAFIIKMIFGDMASILIEGQRVLPQRALDSGFSFRYPSLEEALRESV